MLHRLIVSAMVFIVVFMLVKFVMWLEDETGDYTDYDMAAAGGAAAACAIMAS